MRSISNSTEPGSRSNRAARIDHLAILQHLGRSTGYLVLLPSVVNQRSTMKREPREWMLMEDHTVTERKTNDI